MLTSNPSKDVQSHFLAVDPRIAPLIAKTDYSTLARNLAISDYYTSLLRHIVYQQLSDAAASTIFARFSTLADGAITPERISRLDPVAVRGAGISAQKLSYISDLTTRLLGNSLDLTRLTEMSDGEVIAELTKVKGIGRWTAEMFLLFTLGRENIFSHGDLGLRKSFAALYGLESPTKEDIEQVVSRWSPYKSYGSLALWHYLDN